MNRFVANALACSAALLLSAPCHAGKLIAVPQVPGGFQTEVTGINDNNFITGGYFYNSGGTSYEDGFVGTLNGQYTKFFHPARDVTVGIGIDNDGNVTGVSRSYLDGLACGNALVRSADGTIKDVTKHGEVFDSQALGITRRGTFVGWACAFSPQIVIHGFLGKGTKYKADIVLPFNTDRTAPDGINRDGTIVGSFKDKNLQNRFRGFVLSGDTATAFDYPDGAAVSTFFDAINDKGLVAGDWYDADFKFHPFLFDSNTLSFAPIVVPGATSAGVGGVNNAGIVTINADSMPYVYCTKKKSCPSSAKGIDILERWMAVPARSLQVVLCRDHCLIPRL
jgi:hypothetical protein